MATFGIEVEKTDKEVIYIMEVTPISLTNKYPLIDTSVPTHTQTLRKGKKIYIKRPKEEKKTRTNSMTWAFLRFTHESTHTLFIEYLLEHYCILILPNTICEPFVHQFIRIFSHYSMLLGVLRNHT